MGRLVEVVGPSRFSIACEEPAWIAVPHLPQLSLFELTVQWGH